MTTYLTPSVGTVGVIKLKTPFTGLVAENVPYEVTGVQALSAITDTGIDPYAVYYQPYDLTQDQYAQDVANKVCILTFMSADGQAVRVPNSYLDSLPIGMGVPYATMLVAVKLGALPQDLSLQYFMSKVAALANDLMGIQNADVRAMRASSVTYLTVEDSTTIEAARQAVMDSVVTDAAQLAAAQAQLTELQSKYSDLEAYVIAHPAP